MLQEEALGTLVLALASGLEGKVHPGHGLSLIVACEWEHQVGVAGEDGKNQSEFLCPELIFSDVPP